MLGDFLTHVRLLCIPVFSRRITGAGEFTLLREIRIPDIDTLANGHSGEEFLEARAVQDQAPIGNIRFCPDPLFPIFQKIETHILSRPSAYSRRTSALVSSSLT